MNALNRIGILGGGQLALMLAQSCRDEKTSFVSADKENSCAFSIATPYSKDLNDLENVKEFCSMVDVVTFDSEFMGTQYADLIMEQGVSIYPSKSFVELSGDRFAEKNELNRLGIKTANFIKIDEDITLHDLENLLLDLVKNNTLSKIGIVVKTRHGGYDGKGQWLLTRADKEKDFKDLSNELIKLVNSPGLIVEGMVDYEFECSIIATRSLSGEIVTWPLIHNIHKDSILNISRCPIKIESITDDEEQEANKIVITLLNEHNYVGTICIELFKTSNGLIANEIAPRVHNSGHLTIDGSITSQFKNHINAISGQNLGSAEMIGFCAMINIVGFEPSEDTKDLVNKLDNVFLHWYNKEVRLKRKVGHINIVAQNSEELEETISQILETI